MGNKGMGFPADGVPDQGWKLYITSLVMIILAGLFVIARLTSRYWYLRLGWDDLAITCSLGFSIVVSVAMQLAIQNGYGMHKADLETDELRTALKLFFVAQTPYKVTVCLNKVAAILLYLRIFVTRSFRISAYVVMGIVVAWSIAAIGATIWQCIPISGAWNKSVDAKCIDSDAFWVAYAVANILTDAMVLALPVPSIMKLKLSLRDRLLLCGVFLMGAITTVASILRVTSVQNSLKNKEDITWNFIERGMWTLIEANLGIITACLPVLKQPLSHLFPRFFASTKRRTSYYVDNIPGKGRGYNLSNISAPEPSPGLWRGTNKSQQERTISGPDTSVARMSDEQHIISQSTKGSDSELESRESTSMGGIVKRVDLVRTSFHQDMR